MLWLSGRPNPNCTRPGFALSKRGEKLSLKSWFTMSKSQNAGLVNKPLARDAERPALTARRMEPSLTSALRASASRGSSAAPLAEKAPSTLLTITLAAIHPKQTLVSSVSLPYTKHSFDIGTHVISNVSEKSMRRNTVQQLLGSSSAPAIVNNNLVYVRCRSLFRGWS
jgi:hypothetical protein